MRKATRCLVSTYQNCARGRARTHAASGHSSEPWWAHERQESEADHCNHEACHQRGPEADVGQQGREYEEHRQRRQHVPERIPSVVRDLGGWLVLDMQPDQGQDCYQWKRGDESAQLVAELCRFGDDHYHGCSDEILGDQPRHPTFPFADLLQSQSDVRRSRSAFMTTDTELSAMAAPANTGDSSSPNGG